MSDHCLIRTIDDVYGIEELVIDGHRIQLGGHMGDGYCYQHRSFRCVKQLTPEQQARVDAASMGAS